VLRRWRNRLIATTVLVLAVALGAGSLGLLPDGHNPFGHRTVDRSPPAVLKAVQDLNRYIGASGNFQVIVDLERDAKFIPSFIYGSRVVLVVIGTVDAYVDCGGLRFPPGSGHRVSRAVVLLEGCLSCLLVNAGRTRLSTRLRLLIGSLTLIVRSLRLPGSWGSIQGC
jgi:hypothetical protein